MEYQSNGQVIAGQTAEGLPKEVQAMGYKSGVRKGWKGLAKGEVVAYRLTDSKELSVALVLFNDKANECVQAHSYRSSWTGTAVTHAKEYRRSDAEGSEIVTEPTEETVRCQIQYRALVKVVELYVDGRMFQGDASALSKGGWSFKLDAGERVRSIAIATVLEKELMAQPLTQSKQEDYCATVVPLLSHDSVVPELLCGAVEAYDSMNLTDKEVAGASGLSCITSGNGSHCVYNEEDRRNHRDSALRLTQDEIHQILMEDDTVSNIARPEDLMDQPLYSKSSTESKKPAINTFTFSQKKQLKSKEREQVEGIDLKPKPLDPAFAERLRAVKSSDGISTERRLVAQKAWMKKLQDADYSGPTLDRSRYLSMRNTAIEGNPRHTKDYRTQCCEAS